MKIVKKTAELNIIFGVYTRVVRIMFVFALTSLLYLEIGSVAYAALSYNDMIGAWMDANNETVLEFRQNRLVVGRGIAVLGKVIVVAMSYRYDILVRYGSGHDCGYSGVINSDKSKLLLVSQNTPFKGRACVSGLLKRSR